MKIDDILKLSLWPKSKKITSKKGLSQLEELGYNLFYEGKNADLYTTPQDKAEILLVRSDRCSVFDIPLNLQIEGKGKIQTAISYNAASFANSCGVKTAICESKISSDLEISSRCQVMELCKALEADIDGEIVQFELIFRNYLTGSLYEACQKGNDPYGLDLSSSLKQWHKFEKPIFTPTTKGVKDIPLNSQKVRDTFPEIISSLEELFFKFTKYANDRGIVVVDTKFEVFVNSKGEWILGDEILTPESSRFIALENFEKENYISMDKQILRNFAKENNWKEKAKDLKSGEKLDVEVPQSIKDEILEAYNTIYTRLK